MANVAVPGVMATPTPGAMASVACANFEGSACGVTVMVTVSGVGAAAGAMYVAESDAVLPLPADCVVTVVSVPQPLPLQPVPLSVHDTTVLGFEPGTAVRVATIAALAPVGTLAGAEIVKVKWLPMVIDAEACFVGSATLCAETVTNVGVGNICGAVKFPAASTLPQLFGQEAPERLQRTAESGCPALEIIEVKACNAPSSTPATLGVNWMEMSLTTVTFGGCSFGGIGRARCRNANQWPAKEDLPAQCTFRWSQSRHRRNFLPRLR